MTVKFMGASCAAIIFGLAACTPPADQAASIDDAVRVSGVDTTVAEHTTYSAETFFKTTSVSLAGGGGYAFSHDN